ncbi:STAS domain-containing protein [Streptomyces sp900116325]|uniref:STAS domain-containing protein n=1 Tax=Streptomyces sp. 900116325 TaxID=3154295 RepID=UPI0033F03279
MGLGMIVAIAKRIREHDGSLRITCIHGRIVRFFEISGLHATCQIYESLEYWGRNRACDPLCGRGARRRASGADAPRPCQPGRTASSQIPKALASEEAIA